MAMAEQPLFGTGRVAVVTGAALGIGRAMALRFAERGMRVAMADLAGDQLDQAVDQVRAKSSEPDAVLAVPTDVSVEADIARLRSETLSAFGAVHVLCNNAVTRIGRGHDADLSEWRAAIDTNVFGPVMAMRAFLPDIERADGRRAIINVGSKQGITNPPGHPVYNMAKAALKTYTEALEHDLRTRQGDAGGARISAHLLVPGWTTTGTAEHKPGAWLPEQVVDLMIERVDVGDFYIICPDGEVDEAQDRARIAWAAGDITENRPALSRWHPAFAQAAKDAGC
jgi:NAD(P)-dependent dehydrogenase (short-subunit alcohol dehydrogenase family)